MARCRVCLAGFWHQGSIPTGRTDPRARRCGASLRARSFRSTASSLKARVTVSEYVAWVMNLAHNGVTRYPAYPFDFVVRFQGKHYLANSSGIYELGAADDDGEPIDAEFGLPPSDFGSTQEKRCPRLYIKGNLVAKWLFQSRRMRGHIHVKHGRQCRCRLLARQNAPRPERAQP